MLVQIESWWEALKEVHRKCCAQGVCKTTTAEMRGRERREGGRRRLGVRV